MREFATKVALIAGTLSLFAGSPAAAAYLGSFKLILPDETYWFTLESDTLPGASNTITAITNFAVEENGSVTTPTATLSPTGIDLNPSGPGTDNLWLNAYPVLEPHLNAGGFAFSYGSPSEEYQVFYELATDTYRGCDPHACYNIQVEAVPEPTTWALLVSGFGLTGAVMRRRRPAVVAD
jgi:hypothetical protein